jgi:Nucleotidyl transferase AbiEii toxin, Type IV TA system
LNRFATPASFRQSLEERLRVRASKNVGRLRKRLAMEGYLVRLQRGSAGEWVLKGGVALELRLRERARTTVDMDLAIELEVSGARSAIGEEIRDRLQEDAEEVGEDYFEFTLPQRADTDLHLDGVNAHRFQVVASLAGRVFDRFQLDVAPDEPGSVPTEDIDGSGLLLFAGIPVATRFPSDCRPPRQIGSLPSRRRPRGRDLGP